MIFRRHFIGGLLVLGISGMAFEGHGSQVIVNGGFETGNFSGWSASSSNAHLDPTVPGNCDQPWAVASTGAGAPSLLGTNCFTVADPIGSFAAYNSFDGDGPQSFTLSQTVVVPIGGVASALLSWAETYRVANSGLARQFNINIIGSSTVNIFNETFIEGSGPIIDYQQLTFLGHNLDISTALGAFAGETVQIAFVATIPETYTGPGGFGLDTVALDVVAVPEPLGFALFGGALISLCYIRRRRPR